MFKERFWIFIFFVQCNYRIVHGINFFLPGVKEYFWFFNLSFPTIIMCS